MKITLVEVRNYRALEHVDVRPGDRNLVIVGGKNRAGKTSLLSALGTAFGGAREQPPEPVRHGRRHATIRVELDDGMLTIDRIIDREGRHKLEVHTKEGGKQKAPQKVLDQLIGARFLDPLRFLQLNPKAQRDLLVQVADIDVDLTVLADERRIDYEQRRNVNRDLKRVQGAAAQLGDDEEPVVVTPAAELLTELDARRDEQAALNREHAEAQHVDDDIADLARAIETIREELAQNERDLGEMKLVRSTHADLIETMRSGEDIAKDIDALIPRAAAIAEDAAKAAAIDERNARRKQARDEAEALEQTSETLTSSIEALDQKKTDALERAKMPIPGLDIDEDRVIYNGAPFEQAADSERLHAALAIAAALSKDIRDVWMRDGSLLDRDSLAAIERFAEESGCRVWIERVGDDDSQALIIQEGELREDKDEEPAP